MPVKTSTKALGYLLFAILGSTPDAYGIVLDEKGRASIRDLYAAIREEEGFSWITPDRLRQFFLYDTSGFFHFENDHAQLSMMSPVHAAVLTYEEFPPPHRLYAPIRHRAMENTALHGLSPAPNRAWVVLARSADLALRMGRRKDREPVLAEIMADHAARSGLRFYAYGDSLFLVERVDPRWIKLPPVRRRTPKAQEARPAPSQKSAGLPGGFTLDPAHLEVAGPVMEGRPGKLRARTGGEPAWKKARRNSPRR